MEDHTCHHIADKGGWYYYACLECGYEIKFSGGDLVILSRGDLNACHSGSSAPYLQMRGVVVRPDDAL